MDAHDALEDADRALSNAADAREHNVGIEPAADVIGRVGVRLVGIIEPEQFAFRDADQIVAFEPLLRRQVGGSEGGITGGGGAGGAGVCAIASDAAKADAAANGTRRLMRMTGFLLAARMLRADDETITRASAGVMARRRAVCAVHSRPSI